ncbi:cupin domain-containing protein [Candidatus Pantoea multigeneris]|uniref:DUF861 domain-containing protein n=1 Tax=Candidatus Pantoea multigeneris TaxID=2608357 RepID=A0ABX0RKA3_9GAMM|nr:cupin domain-containing protein [Pantoea multigeneris]NIF23834.1 DUF861 domain-containing protein [Pantoea multigeneris]
MKVQKIAQAATTDQIDARGDMEGVSGSPVIALSGKKVVIPGKESVNTGIFECTAGSYRRVIKQAEIMHILQGEGSFTPDGEEPVYFRPGDALFFAENTEGLWVIESIMRKVYVIVDAN